MAGGSVFGSAAGSGWLVSLTLGVLYPGSKTLSCGVVLLSVALGFGGGLGNRGMSQQPTKRRASESTF